MSATGSAEDRPAQPASPGRLSPFELAFRYPILIPLLDLDELSEPLDLHPLWSARRPGPAWVRPKDLLGRSRRPPAEAARALVAERLGLWPNGSALVLAHPVISGRRTTLSPSLISSSISARIGAQSPRSQLTVSFTGKEYAAEQIHIYRIEDGKMIEHWSVRDDLGQALQLGLIGG